MRDRNRNKPARTYAQIKADDARHTRYIIWFFALVFLIIAAELYLSQHNVGYLPRLP